MWSISGGRMGRRQSQRSSSTANLAPNLEPYEHSLMRMLANESAHVKKKLRKRTPMPPILLLNKAVLPSMPVLPLARCLTSPYLLLVLCIDLSLRSADTFYTTTLSFSRAVTHTVLKVHPSSRSGV